MHESKQEARSPGNVNGEKDQWQQSNHSRSSAVFFTPQSKSKTHQRVTSEEENQYIQRNGSEKTERREQHDCENECWGHGVAQLQRPRLLFQHLRFPKSIAQVLTSQRTQRCARKIVAMLTAIEHNAFPALARSVVEIVVLVSQQLFIKTTE